MKTVDRLKRDARDACKYRGHDMANFERAEYWPDHWLATCRKCGKSVYVDPAPAPNSIDISGDAVALTCDVA